MASSPAVDHALTVLTLLARMPEPMAASLISQTLGLPRSSTYRLLAVLGERGFVTYLPDQRRYGLGVAVFELGSAYQRQAPLARIARPLLDRLVHTTTQNAHLAVLHGLVTLGLGEVIAQAVAIVLVTPVNFVGNKLWSFGPRR